MQVSRNPSFGYDPSSLLVSLKRVVEGNPGHLTSDAVENVRQELEDIVPKGHRYIRDGRIVEVIDHDYYEDPPRVTDFYVESKGVDDNKVERLSTALFLELHLPLGKDLVL